METPDRSTVERRVRRIVAVRKAKRILFLTILVIAVSAPFATNLAAGYIAVRESSIVVRAQYFASSSTSSGSLYIAWYLWSDGLIYSWM